MSYKETLIRTVMEASVSPDWESAVHEWDIIDCEEDEDLEGICVCGKENLRYLYEIRNCRNDNILWPVGSCCIRKFGRNDLKDQATIQEQLFRLLHAIRDRKRIELTTEFFSRKLLRYLYEDNAFPPTEYNDGDGWYDYNFLLDIFNRHDEVTERQERKVNGIIAYSLRPYLEKKLRGKIRRKG